MPQLSNIKLTERTAQEAKPRDDGQDRFLWDRELRGFGMRIKPSGTKTWLLAYRIGARQRRYAFGQYPALKAEEARGQARGMLARILDPRERFDPSQARHDERAEGTVAALYERFLAAPAQLGRVQRPRKERTVKEYRYLFERFIIPAFGSPRVSAVTPRDVLRVFDALSPTPRQSNHCLAAMSSFFTWALGKDAPNPARGILRHVEEPRERFLSAEEFSRLGHVLADAHRNKTEPENVLAAIALLTFTGCRRSEVLTLRWDQVDTSAGVLRLGDSKTGAKTVRLNEQAIKVLARIKRKDGNPYVIPSERREGRHLHDLERPWRRIRAKAGLADVRLHDLRHSYASVAVAGGESLPMIGKLLGHTRTSTTERYAHLQADAIKAANEKVGNVIAAAMRRRKRRVASPAAA